MLVTVQTNSSFFSKHTQLSGCPDFKSYKQADVGSALVFGKFSSTRGAWTQRLEAEPGVLGCLGELCCSPSFPLLTPHPRQGACAAGW